jgi:lysophospholipase L1-like esterase
MVSFQDSEVHRIDLMRRQVSTYQDNNRVSPLGSTARVVLFAMIYLFAAATAFAEDAVQEAERLWGEAIGAFAAADRLHPPPQDGVLFVGSSSIRLWKLDEHFPDWPTINRGFGGSQLSDALYFADRIVLPYRPRVVVLYAGDNDIAAGESPEQVAGDFRLFVRKIHETLPEARIAVISIKPSIARWNLYNKMKEANERISRLCGENERLAYIDVANHMLGDDGRPRSELFADDGLHLNEAGYQLWTEIVKPRLQVEPAREPAEP